jgi:glycosyltransferase involved in cell wall biosynthesis
MRILQVIDIGWLAGGAERSVVTLRDNLVAEGHEVRIMATDKNAAGHEVFADHLVPQIRGAALRRIRDFAFYRLAYREMRNLIADFRPEVIHFHTIGELSPSVLFAARDVPHVVTVHGPEEYTRDLFPWHLPPSDYRHQSYRRCDLRLVGRLRIGYLRLVQRPIYLLAFRRCFAFVAPSRFMAKVLTQEVAPARIVQIYNGIDLPPARPPIDSTLLVFIGRLEAVKGVDVLIRAFAGIRESHPTACLAVIGEGQHRDELEALSVELGVAEHVRFEGWLTADDAHQLLGRSAALVIPSVWPENLPTVALEAIGVGRAIVATSVGGIPELVTNDGTGLLAAPYDIAELSAALDEVLSSPGAARRMGDAARQRAHLFDIDRFVANVCDLYERACAA